MIEVQSEERLVERLLLQRNDVSAAFFPGESDRLAAACREMAERFLRGGRLLAFGRRHYMTDAQHVAVEFVHPVIVGKRALPALDLSAAFDGWLPSIVRPEDIVMGFGPPEGDPTVAAVMAAAQPRGVQTFAFGGGPGDYTLACPSGDPFIHQEIVEVLYHTLWETVHVFFEHRERGHDVGQAAFLYPFLGQEKQDTASVVSRVSASIRAKAEDDARLRAEVAASEAGSIARAAEAIAERASGGGTVIFFGNGGSATDANDWALDFALPVKAFRPVPAVSLSMEPANLTAVANDIGTEAIFLRQLIAQARPRDVAVAISTSGGSRNVIAALEEARKRGLLTMALLGYDGGEIVRRGLADVPIVVRSDYIPRIQEVQASIYHVIVETVGRLQA
jgi:D-sedoheptulose 7-phosphate isomerase